MLMSFGLVSRQGGGLEIPEIDQDLDSEIDKTTMFLNERIEKIKLGIQVRKEVDTVGEAGDDEGGAENDDLMDFPWADDVDRLTTQKEVPLGAQALPAAHLKVEYVYGYRGFDSRNNLKVVPGTEKIVYTSASLVIVEDLKTRKQVLYTEHSNDVSCLDIDTRNNVFASGQVLSNANVSIWRLDGEENTDTLCVIQGKFKNAVQDVAFANTKNHVAAVACDENHTVYVYDYGKFLPAQAAQTGSREPELVAEVRTPQHRSGHCASRPTTNRLCAVVRVKSGSSRLRMGS